MEPTKYAPEVKRRLIRTMLPTALAYAVFSGAGLYFLITEQAVPAVGCILAANVILFAFHRWAGRLPQQNEN
jgi:hypothetical protein